MQVLAKKSPDAPTAGRDLGLFWCGTCPICSQEEVLPGGDLAPASLAVINEAAMAAATREPPIVIASIPNNARERRWIRKPDIVPQMTALALIFISISPLLEKRIKIKKTLR